MIASTCTHCGAPHAPIRAIDEHGSTTYCGACALQVLADASTGRIELTLMVSRTPITARPH